MALWEYGKGLLRTHVTLNKVVETLEDVYGAKITSTVGDITCAQIGIGHGNLSKIAVIRATWPENCPFPEEFVVKIPTLADEAEYFPHIDKDEKMVEGFKEMYNRETVVYNILKDSDLHVPKIFAAVPFTESNPHGFLVMEYMNDCITAQSSANIPVENAKQVLYALAEIAAIGSNGDPDLLNQLPKNLHRSTAGHFFTEQAKTMKLETIMAVLGPSRAHLRDVLKEKIDRTVAVDEMRALDGLCQSLGMEPLLCHGDLWLNNCLWAENGRGELELKSIIDFQLAHVGSIAFDVMFFICSALSGKDRMAKTEELLQYFYNILVEKTEGKLKMTYEQFHTSCDRFFDYCAFSIAIMLSYSCLKLVDLNPIESEIVMEKLTALIDQLAEPREHCK